MSNHSFISLPLTCFYQFLYFIDSFSYYSRPCIKTGWSTIQPPQSDRSRSGKRRGRYCRLITTEDYRYGQPPTSRPCVNELNNTNNTCTSTSVISPHRQETNRAVESDIYQKALCSSYHDYQRLNVITSTTSDNDVKGGLATDIAAMEQDFSNNIVPIFIPPTIRLQRSAR